MSFVAEGSSDKDKELVYGLFDEVIKEVFVTETFDLSPLCSDKIELMDAALCGVARGWLPEFKTIAPLVTYGVTVKQVPSSNLFGGFGDERDYVPVVAVYKQRKTDKEGKEYHVLSIGLSGDVLAGDITGYLELDSKHGIKRTSNVICLQDTLSRAAQRHYTNATETMMLMQREGVNFQFLRDGKRKPGYEGSAHVAAVYTVTLDPTDEVIFSQDGYEMMGWLTLEDLQILVHTQMAIADLKENGQDIHFAGNVNKGIESRLGHLWRIPLEPWSYELAIDQSGYFEHFIRNAVYHQQL